MTPAWPPHQYSLFLSQVCAAIRLGKIDQARSMLDGLKVNAEASAAYLNLLGIVHELQGEWTLARRCYCKAIRADRRYEPAQQNMRRWFELHAFGHSAEPFALGDEAAEVCETQFAARPA